MSKQLTEEEAIQLIRSNPSARNRYNWDKWMDGEWHHVFRNVDYSCTDTSFRNLLYLKVKKFGKIKAIKLEDGFLIKIVGIYGPSRFW